VTRWAARAEGNNRLTLFSEHLGAPPAFSSQLIYVNARMNSFQRDLTSSTLKDFDANDT